MTEQYIVAVFLDASLVVDACGPFRSRERADEASDRINAAGEWTEADPEVATTIAQVVTLRSVADLVAAAGPRGEVGTGAGEGAPRQLISVPGLDAGSAWVTRSEDCPEAPAQAHLPVFGGPVAGTCRACGQGLVHVPGEKTYHPWDVQWPAGKCPALLPLDEHSDALSTRVPDSEFIPNPDVARGDDRG